MSKKQTQPGATGGNGGGTEQTGQAGQEQQQTDDGSTEQTARAGSTKNEQTAQAGSSQTEQDAQQQDGQQEQTGDTFDRPYVENLRKESGDWRKRATAAEQQLHTYRVAELGKLQDPTDLPYSSDYDTAEKLEQAVDELLERKPHLRARQVAGDVGQHDNGDTGGGFSLTGMLRQGA